MSMLLMGVGGRRAAAGVWTTVYTWGGESQANDNGWSGYTFVSVVPIASFSATGGTKIRLTFDGAAGGFSGQVYIGNGGGADAFDFGDMPAGGNVTVPNGADGVTDQINFVKESTNPLVVAIQFTGGYNLRRNSKPGSLNSWYKNSAADAATQDKSGYSANISGSSYVRRWNF